MSKKLPVGIQVYGLRDLLEKHTREFQERDAAGEESGV